MPVILKWKHKILRATLLIKKCKRSIPVDRKTFFFFFLHMKNRKVLNKETCKKEKSLARNQEEERGCIWINREEEMARY